MGLRGFEPRVGEVLRIMCVEDDGSYDESCAKCFFNCDCDLIVCSPEFRRDGKSVHFECVKLDEKKKGGEE